MDRLICCIFLEDGTCTYLTLRCVDPRNKFVMINKLFEKLQNKNDIKKIVIYPAGEPLCEIKF